jgi:integrase
VPVVHPLLEQFKPGEWGLLFTTPAGGPVSRNRFGRIWSAAATKAGARPGATFYACRHDYASLLIRHGESVKSVQARLDHASASETLDTYSHLWPDSEDRTRRAIDDVLGNNSADISRTSQG